MLVMGDGARSEDGSGSVEEDGLILCVCRFAAVWSSFAEKTQLVLETSSWVLRKLDGFQLYTTNSAPRHITSFTVPP